MTLGISPKVALPAIVLTIIGAALVAAGAVFGDGTVSQAGAAVLAAAGVGAGVGYRADPGIVTLPPNPGVSNDAALDGRHEPPKQ